MTKHKSTPSNMSILDSVGLSDLGQVRKTNEDAVFCKADEGLFVLADGMGGHASGQYASNRAIEAIDDYLIRWRKTSNFTWPLDPNPHLTTDENHLTTALRIANIRVYNEAQKDEKHLGMGTTAVLLMVTDDSVVIGHVGDSRCYTFNEEKLVQITEDHSLVNQLMRAFNLSEQEALAKAGKNVLIQSIGTEEEILPEVKTLRPKHPTTFLLCSDGLTDMLSDKEIQTILTDHRNNLSKAGKRLMEAANKQGGNDNISVILVRIGSQK